MISTTLVALSALALSASARQIQSRSTTFYNAGIQGCIAVAENADGEAVTIHNCNTEDLALQDWTATFAIRGDTSPNPIKIVGNKCIDVKDGKNADGTKLQIWTCSGGPNQQFVGRLDGSFQWAGSNKCIDLTDGRITDGTQLQLYTCGSGNLNQQWDNAPNPDAGGLQILLGGNRASPHSLFLRCCMLSLFPGISASAAPTQCVVLLPLALKLTPSQSPASHSASAPPLTKMAHP
ncbi:ricin B lectin domain-containing protein [Mycena belliarum]|uniref:Ricin B lectin domain-containing protein n=1 Tax=Mycena belliarum TaxID=1033014 RepID=A0AAD6XQR3_9AGAR|nr:ricin B lectin domain-containing protein [Mycena belliae]